MKCFAFKCYLFFIILIFTQLSCKNYNKNIAGKDLLTKQNIEESLPQAIGFINDFENILTDTQEVALLKLIKNHESLTTNQIAIVTTNNYQPYNNIYDYSLNLAKFWGVGQKEKDNGILIALSVNLKQVQIQNGFGIEDKLTDEETKKIIDETILPEFKNANYYFGLKKGIEAIILEL